MGRPIRNPYASSNVRKDLRVAVRKQQDARIGKMMRSGASFTLTYSDSMTIFRSYRRPAVPIHQRLMGSMRHRKMVRSYPRKDGKSQVGPS